MNKKKLAILEKYFAAEINSALSPQPIPPLCQLKDSKDVSELLDEEMIIHAECKLGGRFPVTIKGYVLTQRGRYAYCTLSSCDSTSVDDAAMFS